MHKKSIEETDNIPTPPVSGFAAYQQTINQKTQKNNPTLPSGTDLIKTNIDSPAFKARFNKTFEREEAKKNAAEEEGESKYRRVAKLLILIGSDEASKILSHLDAPQVEAVSKEIATIRGVTPEEAAGILVEFRSLLSDNFSFNYKYSGKNSGGIEIARELLHTAFGKEKGEALLRRTMPEAANTQFSFLEKFTGEQLVVLLKDENIGATALVLARLPPKLAADVINSSPPKKKIELIQRLSRLDKVSPEVLDRIAVALKEKVKTLGDAINSSTGTTRIDGLDALSAILKAGSPAFGDRILQELGEDDPYLKADLKERLSTLDDVVKAEDRALQEKLYTMTDVEIVLLLKNRSEEFTEKILSNVSAERRAHIKKEEEILGPVRRRDVDNTAKAFLDWFREKREAGEILLIDDEDIIE